MAELTEIRWHARAGQGAVTAAKLVAETALELDKFFQASPEYGPERMGAPLRAFTRISDEPINIHCNIVNPNIVIVLDATLLKTVNVTDGLTDDGVIIINTELTPAEIRQEHDIKKFKVFTVDASKIAIESIGKNFPNIPIIGALLGSTNIMDGDKVVAHIRRTFGKKFNQEIVDGNVQAFERAQREVRGD
ncbi:MAG TPA: pyruvate synthase [Actinobacteria bacterium]|nr:pyruvate synthase [Actinomycetes bacterium]HEX21448.1 pyruvate synthase [Actinomycetota bacterium]